MSTGIWASNRPFQSQQRNYKLQLPRVGWLPPIKYVQIQTHSRCNADCVFCPYIESAHAASPGMMKDETWWLILDNLAPFSKGINTGKVCPYLMQEPMIDRTIFDKINNIYDRFPQTCVEISTNGAALTERAVDRLFGCFYGKRHDLWISHHGIDQSSLEHVMKIDYDKANANIIACLKKSDGRFTIKIRGAGESADGRKVYFTAQQYRDHWADQFVKHSINTHNISVDAFRFHDRAGTLYRADRGACDLNMGTVREIGPNKPPFHCCRLDEWLHFMYDGTIRLCCMDYHAEVLLPSIHDGHLLDYFHSKQYADIVEKVSGRTESPDKFICKRCTSPGG